MANCPRNRGPRPSAPPAPKNAAGEPAVRRWPHMTQPAARQADEDALHYIRCALSYQNQLLAEIRTLLEQLALRERENTAQSS